MIHDICLYADNPKSRRVRARGRGHNRNRVDVPFYLQFRVVDMSVFVAGRFLLEILENFLYRYFFLFVLSR